MYRMPRSLSAIAIIKNEFLRAMLINYWPT